MDLGQLEEWYAAHSGALVRFAATLVGAADAEDLVATVVADQLRRIDGTDSSVERMDAYMYRAVTLAARKHWRTIGRRTRRESYGARPDRVDFEPGDTQPEVIASLAGLSPQQRAVIHLAYWDDLTPIVIADRLGVGEGTVRRQLARARRRLREVLVDVR